MQHWQSLPAGSRSSLLRHLGSILACDFHTSGKKAACGGVSTTITSTARQSAEAAVRRHCSDPAFVTQHCQYWQIFMWQPPPLHRHLGTSLGHESTHQPQDCTCTHMHGDGSMVGAIAPCSGTLSPVSTMSLISVARVRLCTYAIGKLVAAI